MKRIAFAAATLVVAFLSCHAPAHGAVAAGDSLPFVSLVQIGAPPPCIECPTQICPGESFPVILRGAFPATCYTLDGVDLVPSPIVGPRPEPPIVRIRVGLLREVCVGATVPWSARVILPGLPSGPYELMMEEVWERGGDSTQVDSTFHASLPFAVAERCSLGEASGCFLWSWPATGQGCSARLVNGSARLALSFATSIPAAGIQGDLVFDPPGQLAIRDLAPVGAASAMRVAWQPTPAGARFVLLDVDGHPIAPSDALIPILEVGVTSTAALRLEDAVALGIRWSGVSDPQGRLIAPCPTFIAIGPARICAGAGPCDHNGDGVADVRDLVLMVRCLLGTGACSDTSVASLDCDHDGRKTLDDVWCCARVVLQGGIPGTVPARSEPSVHVSLGVPADLGSGFELPVRVSGADRLGGARLVFDFPADRYGPPEVDPVAPDDWMVLHEIDGGHLTVGLLALRSGSQMASDFEFRLRFPLKAGQPPAGRVALTALDLVGPDGAALKIDDAPLGVEIGGLSGIQLSPFQPNPSAGATHFSLTLPSVADVELAMHDLAGRRVATLYRGRMEAGVHGFSWDGSDENGRRLNSGIYFLRVVSPAGQASRKLVLLQGN